MIGVGILIGAVGTFGGLLLAAVLSGRREEQRKALATHTNTRLSRVLSEAEAAKRVDERRRKRLQAATRLVPRDRAARVVHQGASYRLTRYGLFQGGSIPVVGEQLDALLDYLEEPEPEDEDTKGALSLADEPKGRLTVVK